MVFKICKYEATIKLFSVQFDVNVESVTAEFQIEFIDLHCGRNVRNNISTFSSHWLS
jgi:hypothetical protein